MTTAVTRADLQSIQGASTRVIRFFEELFSSAAANTQAVKGTVEATGALQNATVLTLSPNAAFANERVLVLDPAFFALIDTGPNGELQVTLGSVPSLNGGFRCTFNLEADTTLDLPTTGRIPSSEDGPFADDAAAATGGIAVGEWYAKTGGTVAWRVA